MFKCRCCSEGIQLQHHTHTHTHTHLSFPYASDFREHCGRRHHAAVCDILSCDTVQLRATCTNVGANHSVRRMTFSHRSCMTSDNCCMTVSGCIVPTITIHSATHILHTSQPKSAMTFGQVYTVNTPALLPNQFSHLTFTRTAQPNDILATRGAPFPICV